MKTLLLLRHGQAEDASPAGDKGRELTSRGERDAAFIGERIAARFGGPDFVIASDAARARETAEVSASTAGYQAEIIFTPDIYEAEVADLLTVIQGLPDGTERALLVGHNPGLTMLALELDREATAPPLLPPATLIALSLDVAHWADAAPRCGQRIAILRPKQHTDKGT